MVGHENKFWREWLIHNLPGDNYWKGGDNSDGVIVTTASNYILTGWHDFFLPQTINDYLKMQSEGKNPYLTIGPWTHFEAARSGIKNSMIWLRAKMFKQNEKLRKSPVKIYIMGANEWREYPIWPPNNMQLTHGTYNLIMVFQLIYPPFLNLTVITYNPADPTPSVGGASTGKPVEDNRALESRSDVITYTSDTLKSDIELIGPVSAKLFIKSSLQYTDFFVKVCDVDSSGKSLNVCDGIQRLFPDNPSLNEDDIIKVTVIFGLQLIDSRKDIRYEYKFLVELFHVSQEI